MYIKYLLNYLTTYDHSLFIQSLEINSYYYYDDNDDFTKYLFNIQSILYTYNILAN